MNKYRIDIQGLKEKEQSYHFVVDSNFFSLYQPSFLNNGLLEANVRVKKGSNVITLGLEVSGKVELICDRSLKEFDYQIHLNKNVLVKFGDRFEELSEDVLIIDSKADSLDISQFLYDFISLEVPLKRVHPDYSTDNEEDETLVYSSQNTSENENLNGSNNSTIDPRWEKLKNINTK